MRLQSVKIVYSFSVEKRNVIRSCILRDKQNNGHRRRDKRTTNDLYNTSQIANDRAT
jgi:hypothetical protein